MSILIAIETAMDLSERRDPLPTARQGRWMWNE